MAKVPARCRPPSSGQGPSGMRCLQTSLYPAVTTLSWRMSFGSVLLNERGLSAWDGPGSVLDAEDTEGRSLCPAQKELRCHPQNTEKDFRSNPRKEGGIIILHKNEA